MTDSETDSPEKPTLRARKPTEFKTPPKAILPALPTPISPMISLDCFDMKSKLFAGRTNKISPPSLTNKISPPLLRLTNRIAPLTSSPSMPTIVPTTPVHMADPTSVTGISSILKSPLVNFTTASPPDEVITHSKRKVITNPLKEWKAAYASLAEKKPAEQTTESTTISPNKPLKKRRAKLAMNNAAANAFNVVSTTDDEKSKDCTDTPTAASNIVPSLDTSSSCGNNPPLLDDQDISPSILNCFSDMSGQDGVITLYAEHQGDDVIAPAPAHAPNISPNASSTPEIKNSDQSERFQLTNFKNSLQPSPRQTVEKQEEASPDLLCQEPPAKKKKKRKSFKSLKKT